MWMLLMLATALAATEPFPAYVGPVPVTAEIETYAGGYRPHARGVRVRHADGTAVVIDGAEVDVRVLDTPDARFYLGLRRHERLAEDGTRTPAWRYRLAYTDGNDTLRDVAFGHAGGNVRVHTHEGPSIAGVDRVLLVEFFRTSCPGGSSYDLWAVRGHELRWLASMGGYGEVGTAESPGQSDHEEVYLPFDGHDGLVWRAASDGREATLDGILAVADRFVRVHTSSLVWSDAAADRVQRRELSHEVSVEPIPFL